MTVVEKIISLCDQRMSILCFGKQYRPEEQEKLNRISVELDRIRCACPKSWKAAERILRP